MTTTSFALPLSSLTSAPTSRLRRRAPASPTAFFVFSGVITQAGRNREFIQTGVEILGGKPNFTRNDAVAAIRACLEQFSVEYRFVNGTERGLSHYVESGFEVDVESLRVQEQIAVVSGDVTTIRLVAGQIS